MHDTGCGVSAEHMKRRILVFAARYLPGYKAGGPIRSISNLVDCLGDEFDFWIVTTDRDFGDTQAYVGIEPNEWQVVGKARVIYVPPTLGSLRFLIRLLRHARYDLLYLNSFFDPRFTGLPLLVRRLGFVPRRSVLLAPRGELSRGAVALKSYKKRLYLSLTRWIGLYADVRWQATTELEVSEIRAAVGRLAHNIVIATNLARSYTEEVSDDMAARPESEALRIAFLSRISEKKNLVFALEVLGRCRVPIVFSIYGPKEDQNYWSRCEAAIERLPTNVQVVYQGIVEPDRVVAQLRAHDLFFLPTLNENFGHVIVEALQAGLPVLISDQTPWRQLRKKRVGCDCPLSRMDCFVEYIEQMARLSAEERREVQRCVREFARTISREAASVEENRILLRE